MFISANIIKTLFLILTCFHPVFSKLKFSYFDHGFKLAGDTVKFTLEKIDDQKNPDEFRVGLFLANPFWPRMVAATEEIKLDKFINGRLFSGLLVVPKNTVQSQYVLKAFVKKKIGSQTLARAKSFLVYQTGISPFILPYDRIVTGASFHQSEDYSTIRFMINLRLGRTWFTKGIKIVVRNADTNEAIQTVRKRFWRSKKGFPKTFEFPFEMNEEFPSSVYLEIYRWKILRANILVYRSARFDIKKNPIVSIPDIDAFNPNNRYSKEIIMPIENVE